MAVRTKNIADFIPEVIDEVPGATDPEIALALRTCARNFLKKTELWQEELADLDIVALQRTYVPSITYDADIQRILWIKLKTESTDDFDDIEPSDEDLYDIIEDNEIYFLNVDYAPDYALVAGMRIKVVLVPQLGCLEIPERICNDWGDIIIAGAKEILARSPRKPYTNPKVEADNHFFYNSGVTSALAEMKRKNKNSTPGFSA